MSSRRAALEVHEWRGTFRGEPASFKMTSVIGHVYSLDFPPAYNSWDRVDPLELFDAATVKSEANPKVQPAAGTVAVDQQPLPTTQRHGHVLMDPWHQVQG